MEQIVKEYYTQDGCSIAQCIEKHKENNPTHIVKHFQMTQDNYKNNYGELVYGAYAVVIYEDNTNECWYRFETLWDKNVGLYNQLSEIIESDYKDLEIIGNIHEKKEVETKWSKSRMKKLYKD